jgi:hypothetical protein
VKDRHTLKNTGPIKRLCGFAEVGEALLDALHGMCPWVAVPDVADVANHRVGHADSLRWRKSSVRSDQVSIRSCDCTALDVDIVPTASSAPLPLPVSSFPSNLL